MLGFLQKVSSGKNKSKLNKQQRLEFLLIALVILLGFSLTGCAGIGVNSKTDSKPLSMLGAATDAEFILTTDRGEEPVYKKGDVAVIRVGLGDSGFLNCFYQPGSGEIIRLYPNRFQSQAQVPARVQVSIPGTDEFAIQFDQSDTTEQFLCLVASSDINPFVAPQLRNQDFESIDLILLSSMYNKEVRTLDDIFVIYNEATPQKQLQAKMLTVRVQ